MISPSHRPLPDNTQHSQQTNIHAPGGIRTHNLSRRAAKDLRLRPRGHWDRHGQYYCSVLFPWSNTAQYISPLKRQYYWAIFDFVRGQERVNVLSDSGCLCGHWYSPVFKIVKWSPLNRGTNEYHDIHTEISWQSYCRVRPIRFQGCF